MPSGTNSTTFSTTWATTARTGPPVAMASPMSATNWNGLSCGAGTRRQIVAGSGSGRIV